MTADVQNAKHQLIRRWSGALGLQLATAFTSLMFLVVTSRTLDIADRGRVASFTVSVLVLGTVSCAGYPQAILFFAARGRPGRTLIRIAAWRLAVVLVVCLLILVVVLRSVGLQDPSWILIGVLLIPIIQATTCIQYLLLAEGMFGQVALVRAVVFTMTTIPLFIPRIGESPTACAWLYLFSWLTSGMIYLVIARPQLDVPGHPIISNDRNKYHRYAFHSAPQAISSYILSRADVWLVALVSTKTQAAIYAGSIGLAEFAAFIPTALGSGLFVGGARQELGADHRSTVWWTVFLCAVGTIIGVLAAPVAVSVLLGSSYDASVTPLRIASIGALALGLQRLISSRAAGEGRPWASAVSSTVGAVVILITVPLLATPHGAVGGAIGFTVASFAGLATALVADRFPEKA